MCNTEILQEEWEEHQKIEAWNQKKQMRNAWEKRQNELINEWSDHLNNLDNEWDQHLKIMENEWNKRRRQFHKRREIKIDEAEMALVDDPAKCHKLALDIESAVEKIYRYWRNKITKH